MVSYPSARSLLPLNATEFEQHVEQGLLVRDATQQVIGHLRGIKLNPPDELLPWLVWEYGLTAIVPYLPNLRVVIRDGLLWQKERGTEAGIRRALAWIGIDPDRVEDEVPGVHWNELQLDTGVVPSAEQLRRIIALTMMSTPARTKLKRLYHGCDRRRFILDASRWGDLLDDYSGIRPPEYKGLVLSFCHRMQTMASAPLDVVDHAVKLILGCVVAFIQSPRLDEDTIFGELATLNNPALISLFFIQSAGYNVTATAGTGVALHYSAFAFVPEASTAPVKLHIVYAQTVAFKQRVDSGSYQVTGCLAPPYASAWRRNAWTAQPWLNDILIASDAA